MSGNWQHLYGTKRWRSERLDFLNHNPICTWLGCNNLSTVVDHHIPHKGDEALFWDKANWRAMCKSCHDSAKQSYERTGKIKGADLRGLPLDRSHHWHTEK